MSVNVLSSPLRKIRKFSQCSLSPFTSSFGNSCPTFLQWFEISEKENNSKNAESIIQHSLMVRNNIMDCYMNTITGKITDTSKETPFSLHPTFWTKSSHFASPSAVYIQTHHTWGYDIAKMTGKVCMASEPLCGKGNVLISAEICCWCLVRIWHQEIGETLL